MVQIIIVSINGTKIATSPSETGSFVFAAPCAIVSVPDPASFENKPLLTPILIIVPIAPPATALPLNASEIISEKTLGTSWIFFKIIDSS